MSNQPAPRGLIYARASRDPKQLGNSVDNQISWGRSYAAQNGVEVIEAIRDDGLSAFRGAPDRPGFMRVRRLIEAGEVDILFVWEVSRLDRDMEEFLSLANACADNGVRFCIDGQLKDPADLNDWTSLSLSAWIAEVEARRIRQRILDTVAANAEKRRPHGRLPYGYRRVYDENTGALLHQTPYAHGLEDQKVLCEEAQVVHDAAHALLAGRSLRSICLDLNARGVPTGRKPRKSTLEKRPDDVVTWWEPSTLRQILRRATIAGRRVHRGRDIGPATWDPIIEYGTWLQVQSLLSDPSRITTLVNRGQAPRHLLSGIARCDECGQPVDAVKSSRMERAYACRHEGCRKITASAPRVDERVVAVLGALFARADSRRLIADAFGATEAGASTARDVARQIAAAERELAELDALRAEGALTARAYGVESARIEGILAALREVEVAPVTAPALRRLVTASSLMEAWEAASLRDQREVVKTLLDIRVRPATTRGRTFDASRVSIKPSRFLLGGSLSLADQDAVETA